MYIISLTYKVPLENIDQYLEAHVAYLNKQYALGNFLVSGKKVPRNGGVIIANASSEKKVLQIIAEDPFKINGLADYDIIEFIPSMSSHELQFLIS